MVGWPTVEAIVGNKIAPGWLDHYLARHGVDAQMTDEPEDPDRPDNLWEPVPGDHGAHGPIRSPAALVELAALGRHEPRLAGRRGRLPRRPDARRGRVAPSQRPLCLVPPALECSEIGSRRTIACDAHFVCGGVLY